MMKDSLSGINFIIWSMALDIFKSYTFKPVFIPSLNILRPNTKTSGAIALNGLSGDIMLILCMIAITKK